MKLLPDFKNVLISSQQEYFVQNALSGDVLVWASEYRGHRLLPTEAPDVAYYNPMGWPSHRCCVTETSLCGAGLYTESNFKAERIIPIILLPDNLLSSFFTDVYI